MWYGQFSNICNRYIALSVVNFLKVGDVITDTKEVFEWCVNKPNYGASRHSSNLQIYCVVFQLLAYITLCVLTYFSQYCVCFSFMSRKCGPLIAQWSGAEWLNHFTEDASSNSLFSDFLGKFFVSCTSLVFSTCVCMCLRMNKIRSN